MNRKSILSLVIGAAALSATPFTQAQVASEIEGPLSSAVANGAGATLTVMGMTIDVPAGTPIFTPSAELTIAQLLDPTELPGRTGLPGFTGATAIVTGTVDANGAITAGEVFVEPAENVVLGVVTSALPHSPLLVNATLPVELLTDPRMPGAYQNDLGFEVELADVPTGTELGVEGYFANGVLYAFHVEFVGVRSALQTLQISALRALGRINKGELEVRGGISGQVGIASVTLFNDATGVQIGNPVQVAEDALLPGTSTFRVRLRGIQVPDTVRVQVANNGDIANVVAPVALR